MQQLRSIKQELQELGNRIAKVKSSTQELTAALPAVQHFADEVQRDVKKWQFKTKPRLDRIQVILDVLKIDSNKK